MTQPTADQGEGRFVGALCQRMAFAFGVMNPDDDVRDACIQVVQRARSWDQVPASAKQMMREAESRQDPPPHIKAMGPIPQ